MKFGSRFFLGFLGVVVFLLSACGGKKMVKLNEGVDETKKDYSIALEWVKNKRDSLDVRLIQHNGYGHTIHFRQNSILLTFNGQKGELNEKEFPVELAPGATQADTLIFKFKPKVSKTGTATLTIDPIYKGDFTAGEKTRLAKYSRVIEFK